MSQLFETLVKRRRVPNEGLYVALTQRCPMRCAHCATSSSLAAPHSLAEAPIRDFLAELSPAARPAFVLFTGGEPFIVPHLLRDLAALVRRAGCKAYAATGGFWTARPAPAIREALAQLDIISFSYDRFHAEEVAQDALFAGIELALSLGLEVGVQTVRDPRLPQFNRDFNAALSARFGARVALFEVGLTRHGRAEALEMDDVTRPADRAAPCLVASWPVITYRGLIVACCHHRIIDGAEPPPHLLLGKLGEDTFADVARRNRERIALRAVRTLGPAAFQGDATAAGEYCAPCLAHRAEGNEAVAGRFHQAGGGLQERVIRLPMFSPVSSIIRKRTP